MKNRRLYTLLVVVLTALLLLMAGGGVAWAQPNGKESGPVGGTERTGIVTISPEAAAAAIANMPSGTIVQDGGFEAGTPSPFWDEFSANFGTPLCNAGCGFGGGSGPHAGSWWTWFGGTTAAETGSVDQDVTIPAGSATLRFWLEIPVAGTTGFMNVEIDGNVIFSVTEADAPNYFPYQEVELDISAYADGGVHNLEFFSQTNAGAAVLNFFIDDVSIEVGAGGGEPEIDVSPASLETELIEGGQATLPLTIANEGTADLTWDIEEDDGASRSGGSWSDNFDSYATDSQMHGQGGWKGWGNDIAFGAFTRDEQALSAPNSVEILGDSDLVHEYSGYNSDVWIYTAWQYIPTDFVGTTYFIMLNTYNDSGTGNNWSTQVNFDSASGFVINDGASGGILPLITGEWVEIRVVIDLDNNTQDFYYGGQLLYSGTWTNEVSGGGVLNIGAVDLFANSATAVYYDNLSLLPAAPGACDVISDIPWLTVSPDAGTTISGTSTMVDVTFDATGLTTGVYTGTLCVNSNDADESLVTVPVTLTVNEFIPVPGLVLTKTVGLDAGSCAATNSIIVPAGMGGTEVTYCYTVQNTGDVIFTNHTLTDTMLGTLLNNEPIDLAPGATYFVTQTVLITETTVNTAYWTAFDAAGATTVASGTATVTQADPTDVNLSQFDGVKPLAMAPVWLAGLLMLAFGLALVVRRRFQA